MLAQAHKQRNNTNFSPCVFQCYFL